MENEIKKRPDFMSFETISLIECGLLEKSEKRVEQKLLRIE